MLSIFRQVLDVPYTHTERGGSYYRKRLGSRLSIFFEKSNGCGDWRDNLDFPAVPYRQMQETWYCHRGFLTVWKDIQPYLEEEILNRQVNSILIAGYSHGGAIAQLCYEFCRYHRPDCKLEGYSFGSPRVVFGKLPKSVNDRFCGFVMIKNRGDIVTHLPLRFLGYRDVGTLVTLFSERQQGPFSAHTPEAYLSALSSCLSLCRETEKRQSSFTSSSQ